MRRDKKEKLKSWGAFPLFWKKCECCESECRLEWVWGFSHIGNHPFDRGHRTNHMVCRSCAETRRGADDFAVAYSIKENDSFPLTPPAKPPGPPNRVFKPCGTEWVKRG